MTNIQKIQKRTGINNLLQKQSKNSGNGIFLNINGQLLTNQKKVANKFNHFFTNVAQKLVNELGESNTEFQDYLRNPSEISFYINEIEPHEVLKLIKKVDETKSSDIYGISPKMIKLASTFIANYLTITFKQ